MRLIDAEDIPYTMLYKENWMKGTGEEAQGAWKRDIDKMPTIDAVPVKHGKWIECHEEENGNFLFECSVCHKGDIHAKEVEVSYCWNCGAKMDGGKDDE